MTNAATLSNAENSPVETKPSPTFWQRLLHYFAKQTEASSKADTKSFEGLL